MEPPSPHDERVQGAWAAHRPYLLAVAAGMLKRRDDAEDVAQEAFARLAASPDAIEDVRGWLVVVTRRLCLDRLDLAENRRTAAFAEPPEAPGGIPDPADRVMLHDEVGQALWVVITGSRPPSGPHSSSTTSSASPSTPWPGSWGGPRRRAGSWPAARLSVGTGSSQAGLAGAWSGSTTAVGLAQRFIAVCEGGDVHGLIGLLDPEVAGFPVVIGWGPMPGVRGTEAVARRAMHWFGPSAGVSLQPFELEGRAAVVVRRGEEVVAVIRLDDREGRIFHPHTFARPFLAS
jgi:RNA polymerase sigma-70 factor, ECF subfamily